MFFISKRTSEGKVSHKVSWENWDIFGIWPMFSTDLYFVLYLTRVKVRTKGFHSDLKCSEDSPCFLILLTTEIYK